jgi:hypothetical protein
VFFGLSCLLILSRPRVEALFPWAARTASNRLLISALPVVLVFLCTFPAYWSTGILGQYRTMNMACFFALPLMLAAVLAWSSHPVVTRTVARVSGPWVAPMLAVLVFAGFFVDRNGERAVTDVFQRRAERCDAQLWARYALLEKCTPTGVTELPLIQDAPTSLHVMDIRPDPSFLQNVDYAEWFGCDTVRPSGPAH